MMLVLFLKFLFPMELYFTMNIDFCLFIIFLSLFYVGTGYNVNYGNPEGGYMGNLYPASFGMNPVSFPFYTYLVCLCGQLCSYVQYQCISE